MGQIFSIGYGNATSSEIASRLGEFDVRYVVDVRSAPYSKFKPEFSRDALQAYLLGFQISYVFMGDLLGGRPRDITCYTDGKVDYEKTKTKPFFLHGIKRLKTAHSGDYNICLFCSESEPTHCHRCKLVGEALKEEGISVTHILPNGDVQSHVDSILHLNRGQTDMFGEHYMSRKTYI